MDVAKRPLEQNAMNRFVSRFTSSIVNVLSCFDRVIFKGYLPFHSDEQLNGFVDRVLKMRRVDFLPFVEAQSQTLVEHAQAMARQAGVPYDYLRGRHDKDKRIRALLRERSIQEGLVAVLCTLETCRTVKLQHGAQRPRLVFAPRPQRVLYFYFLDPECGLVYFRLQSWFPFVAQAYVNGHEWLARQLHQRGSGFVQRDNAFTHLDDVAQAQGLAKRFVKCDWVKILQRWARRFHPLLQQRWLAGGRYYWVIDQAEYSTDLLFRSSQALAALYPRLLDHATLHFSAEDILTFLGRRLHPCFDGEVLTTCRKDRQPGARVKHRVKNNWLKMYDKFGLILRIETVINQPREFKVRRWCTRHGRRQLLWKPMNKGVSNFYRYREVADAANARYLDALAVVEPLPALGRDLDRLSQPVTFHGRRRRGLNVLSPTDLQLFRAALLGEHRLHGLRNRDLADRLCRSASADPEARRRRTARISRLLQLLRAHGLIAKIGRAQRYRITLKGEALMGAALYVRHKAFANELQHAVA
jgi:hypothetical protein